ncbi:MAG: DUF58 domain-containing protein [Actinomycetota bacterium]
MMTRRGAVVLGSGLALVVSWIALGEIELLAAGAAMLMAVGAALFITTWSRPRLYGHRQVRPGQVHEGDRAGVSLSITNLRRLPVFNLSLVDGVGGLGVARFTIGVMKGGESATATYRIVCRPRGVYKIGPTSVSVSDPLGLGSTELELGEADELVVYPATEHLAGYPRVRGSDPAQTASRPEHSQRGGEDFYTLRPYQDGDDLRRVHWPSSAKFDELVIRQMEVPWQSRALVLFDVRSQSFDGPDAFERAVKGAASVVTHLAGGGFAADLWLGGPLVDLRSMASAFEALARVQPERAIDLRSVAQRLRKSGGGGLLVLVTGEPDGDLLGVVRILSAQYRVALLMAATEETSESLGEFQRLGVRTMVAGSGQRWAPAWNRTMERTWTAASAG